jgi:Fe-S-cluster-containing hydrogenase component 2
LTQANFKVILSAEFIGKHSFNVAKGWSLAEDRPNQMDFEIATGFASQSIERLQEKIHFKINLSEFSYHPMEVKEKSGPLAKFYPSRKSNECSMCNFCEKECPVGAFNADSGETNRKLCINCMHCVTVCPDEVIQVGEVSQIFSQFVKRWGLSDNIVDRKKSRIIFKM